MHLIRLRSKLYNLDKLRFISFINRQIRVDKNREYEEYFNRIVDICRKHNIETQDVFSNSFPPEEYVVYTFSVYFEQDSEFFQFTDLQLVIKEYADVMLSIGEYSQTQEVITNRLKLEGVYPTIYWEDYINLLLEERNGKLEKSCPDTSISTI